jgi:hypothetical protein
MKMIYRSALAVGLGLSLAVAAQAQTPPPQNPPPQTPPASPPPQAPYPGRTLQGPEGILEVPPVRDEPWFFSLGINGSYEGNALFTGPSDDKEFSHNVQASIGRAWRLRRGDATFGATATQAFYQDTTSLNDFRYSVAGGIGQAITRRLNWSGSVSLSSGLARDNQELTDAGAVLPSDTETRSSAASTLFNYALSPHSNISWSLATSGIGFSSAAFNDGTDLSTAATYTRRLGNTQTLGASVDYSRTFTTGVESDLSSSVYGFMGVWTLSAGRGWMISASAGVRPYSVPEEDGLRMSTALSAGVTKPVRRNQTIGVTYSKSVEQAFGLQEANNLVQAINVNYGLALHRNVTASFGGSLTHAKDPTATDTSQIGQVAQGSIAFRVLPNLSLSLGSSFYGRDDDSAERTTSTTTYLALTYNTNWR